MNAPQYYAKLKAEFARLHGLGWSYARIAVALDVTERTLTRWRREMRLGKRPRGRKRSIE